MTNLAIDITSLVVSIFLMEIILRKQMCNLIIHNWQITKHQPFQGLPYYKFHNTCTKNTYSDSFTEVSGAVEALYHLGNDTYVFTTPGEIII